jgi:hypothetical protein
MVPMRQTSVRYATEALYRVVSYFANAALCRRGKLDLHHGEEGGGIRKGKEILIVVPSVQVVMVRAKLGGIFYSQTPGASTRTEFLPSSLSVALYWDLIGQTR